MGERNLKFFIASLLIIVSLLFVSADYTLGIPTHNIETSYEPGEKISGWISIQLANESNFTLFEDSEGNSMTLLELINENPSFLYTVNSAYGTIDSTDFQNLNLGEGFFYLPNTASNITYQFNFSGVEVFAEQINISFSTEDLNTTLNNKIEDLNTIKADINSYDLFEQISLSSALKINYIESKLTNLSLDYLSASTQAELDNISASLSLINIPDKIEVTQTAISIPIFPISENVDLNALEDITNTTYEVGEESSYKTAVIGWNINNLNIKISFKEFTTSYGVSKEFLVETFDLEVNKKDAINYPGYIFIEKMNETLFKQDYQEQEQGDYYVFDFVGDTKIISFSTTESINFTNLVFFISPAFTELGVDDFNYVEDDEDKHEQRKWTIFSLVIFLLLILGFIVYLILQTWYKKRYENYLFKDKNDLYNIANYIRNAKKRGFDNSQIQESLRKSRWSSEQIRYALKKYTGKRTLEKKGQGGAPGYGYRRYSLK